MIKPGQKPRRGTPVWTPEFAYACGLLATDGCLSSDGRHLNLTSKDLDQLETFKHCLGLTNKISWKMSTFVQEKRPQVQFGDVLLYRFLVSIGITPRKSKTIGAIKIPDQYFFDYLRGELDGDGSSYAYWDTRWHSSLSIYISFTCASRPHLEWLNETIFRLKGMKGIIKPGRRALVLQFAKTKARLLYEAMYYAEHIPYLGRKKEKLDRQWAANELAKKGLAPEGVRKGSKLLWVT